MPRIVSVWLKSWPIARFLRAQASRRPSARSETIDPRRPFVLVSPGSGGTRLVTLNAAAWRSGLAPGDLLSNARSKVLDLQSCAADPAADEKALRQLALWCLRYTPIVAPWDAASGADGLFLDITGCAHLFGGETRLLADLAARLRRFGLRSRLAVADTAGAAWAAARHLHHDSEINIIPPGEQDRALRDLPLAALRLDTEALDTLCRLGFRRIGELMPQPRAPLVARFGTSLMERLDQALGRMAEPLSPLQPPPCYRAQVTFAEAIMTQAHVIEAAVRLMRPLMRDLERDAAGIRVLRLLLFRVDGEVLPLEIGLAAPTRDAAHIARLLAMRLERLPAGLEADFGFEAAALHVMAAERIVPQQSSLDTADAAGDQEHLSALIDRLQHRLGAGCVQRLYPRQSHIPEHAMVARRADEGAAPDWQIETPAGTRPPLMLASPEEAADIIATVPEGPPRRFRWRGVLHEVAHAEGPERIAPEWWHPGPREPERDYYVVENAAGRRFWLYRAGHYGGAQSAPRWYVHGVFP